MKALILAAGFGSRLMPLTKSVPKCMVEYCGKRIIDYEVESLRDAGVGEIGVVGGYLFEVLKNYVESKFNINKIYKNAEFDSTNMVATMLCAREYLESCIRAGEDLIISYADIVYSAKIVESLAASVEPLSIVVDKEWRSLWDKRFANPLEDAETLKIKDGKVIELGKKPQSYSEIEAQYIGLFKFSSEFLSEVLGFYDSLDRAALYDGKDFKNMYMTSFLQGLIDKFNNAAAIAINGGWCEIDFKSDLGIDVYIA